MLKICLQIVRFDDHRAELCIEKIRLFRPNRF